MRQIFRLRSIFSDKMIQLEYILFYMESKSFFSLILTIIRLFFQLSNLLLRIKQDSTGFDPHKKKINIKIS